jgi:hypothetical protein
VSAAESTGGDLRCSVWTREQGVDPIGSTPTFDALLLVEWPLPWPKDVGEIEALAAAAADPRATVMAVVPQAGDEVVEGSIRVVHHRRVGTHRFVGTDHCVPRDEVTDLLARLLDDLDGDHLDWPTALGPAPSDVLVCGHGRRDPCCGRWGTLLQLELAGRHPDARVWRCSHTGGHRFAPTAITVPIGRAWAWTDADLLVGVLERSAEVVDLAPHDRGSVALPMWAQPVERELFVQQGWAWLDAELTSVAVDVADDRRSAHVELQWHIDGAAWSAIADVGATREIPVLVCGEPPEAAKKSSLELGVTSLVVAGSERP